MVRPIEEVPLELGWEKVLNWDSLFVDRKQRFFLSVYVDDIKMAGKKQNMAPAWKKLMKTVDLDEPTSFLDRVYLGNTQRECKPNETIIEEYRNVPMHKISAAVTEKCRVGQNFTQRWLRGLTTWKDMLKKCVGRCCEWRTKRLSNCTKSQNPCYNDPNFKKEKLETYGELSKACSQIVLKCLYLTWIGRPDIFYGP